MSSKISDLMRQVSAAANEIIGTIQGLDERISALGKQRQEIGDAPVTQAEMLAYISDKIDEQALSMSNFLALSMAAMDKSFFQMERKTSRLPLLTGTHGPLQIMPEEACFLYLKPAILATLKTLSDGLGLPSKSESIPIAKRREMIAEIDVDISKLRVERDDLAGQLQSFGITG